MVLTRHEQETIINFNEEEAFATIYTASPRMKRNFDKLGFEQEREPDKNKVHGKGKNKEVAWCYKVSLDVLRITKKRTLKISKAKRAELRARMIENIHSKKNSQDESI